MNNSGNRESYVSSVCEWKEIFFWFTIKIISKMVIMRNKGKKFMFDVCVCLYVGMLWKKKNPKWHWKKSDGEKRVNARQTNKQTKNLLSL